MVGGARDERLVPRGCWLGPGALAESYWLLLGCLLVAVRRRFGVCLVSAFVFQVIAVLVFALVLMLVFSHGVGQLCCGAGGVGAALGDEFGPAVHVDVGLVDDIGEDLSGVFFKVLFNKVAADLIADVIERLFEFRAVAENLYDAHAII